jgi:hypothetical protein
MEAELRKALEWIELAVSGDPLLREPLRLEAVQADSRAIEHALRICLRSILQQPLPPCYDLLPREWDATLAISDAQWILFSAALSVTRRDARRAEMAAESAARETLRAPPIEKGVFVRFLLAVSKSAVAVSSGHDATAELAEECRAYSALGRLREPDTVFADWNYHKQVSVDYFGLAIIAHVSPEPRARLGRCPFIPRAGLSLISRLRGDI